MTIDEKVQELTWANIEKANEELRLKTMRWNSDRPMQCKKIARAEMLNVFEKVGRGLNTSLKDWNPPLLWWLRPRWILSRWRQRKAGILRYDEGRGTNAPE